MVRATRASATQVVDLGVVEGGGPALATRAAAISQRQQKSCMALTETIDH